MYIYTGSRTKLHRPSSLLHGPPPRQITHTRAQTDPRGQSRIRQDPRPPSADWGRPPSRKTGARTLNGPGGPTGARRTRGSTALGGPAKRTPGSPAQAVPKKLKLSNSPKTLLSSPTLSKTLSSICGVLLSGRRPHNHRAGGSRLGQHGSPGARQNCAAGQRLQCARARATSVLENCWSVERVRSWNFISARMAAPSWM